MMTRIATGLVVSPSRASDTSSGIRANDMTKDRADDTPTRSITIAVVRDASRTIRGRSATLMAR